MRDLTLVDTTIFLGGVSIHQPVTAFTDFIITGLCFFFFSELRRVNEGNLSTNYWSLFYLSLLVATFAGGCTHAFFPLREGAGYKSFWLSMQLFNGFSVYTAQMATLHSVLRFSRHRNLWRRIYILQLLLFIPAVFVFQNFLVVVIDMAVGMIPVMVKHFADAKTEKASRWIAGGILISFLTAFVHLSKFSIHAYFNYQDISHLLIILNLSVMYVGIKQKATVSSLAEA